MKVATLQSPATARSQTIDTLLRSQDPRLPADLFPAAAGLDGLMNVVAAAPSPVADRSRVSSALVRYNEELGNPEGAEVARKLEDPRSVVIITGQQPWLYGGPLMVFAKIAGACALARIVEERAGVPVIPVFWNHSEDHDLDEVNRFYSRQESETRLERLDLADSQGQPLERVVLSQAQVEVAASWVPDRLAELRPVAGESLPRWASRVVRLLLPERAVAHVEPAVLRPLLGEFFGTTLEREERLREKVRTSTASVVAAGFAPQVDVEASSLLFCLQKSGRVALDAKGSSEEAARARTDPGRFSCGVLTRAVAQQWLLPVVAHVNGPAENAYFAQMACLFPSYGLPTPMPWPRPSVTILDPRSARSAGSLGLGHADLLGDPSAWPAPPDRGDLGSLFSRASGKLDEALNELRHACTDEGLRRSIEGFESKTRSGLSRLQRGFERQREHDGDTGRRTRHRLAETVRPRGRPQERIFGPMALLGNRPELIDGILSEVDPLNFKHHVITLSDEDFAS